MDKKGYIHHPVVLFIIGLLLGAALILLMVYNVIPSPIKFCGK